MNKKNNGMKSTPNPHTQVLKLSAALDATAVAELLDGCLSPIAHVRVTCLDGTPPTHKAWSHLMLL